MNTNLVVQIVGGLGGAGILGAAIDAIVKRRKLGADVTAVITQAAGGVVSRLEGENKRQAAQIERQEKRIGELERRDAKRDHNDQLLRDQLQVHRAWDISVALQLRAAGLVVPEPPDLLPDVMRNG